MNQKHREVRAKNDDEDAMMTITLFNYSIPIHVAAVETNRETDVLTHSRVRPRVRQARWSMCKNSSAHDHELPLSFALLLFSPPHPRSSPKANVEPRIFMAAFQGLGFEEIRPACNALRTPDPFLRSGEWSLRSPEARGEDRNFRAHFEKAINSPVYVVISGDVTWKTCIFL